MGWDGIHLFQFDIRAVDYGSWELHAANPDVALNVFELRKNDRFSYIYDMGDYWNHEVRVEAIFDADPKKSYPICTGGAGACPPEECGGPEGYLAAIIHEAPVLARGAMFEGPLLLDAHR
jgi:hypothetical protein